MKKLFRFYKQFEKKLKVLWNILKKLLYFIWTTAKNNKLKFNNNGKYTLSLINCRKVSWLHGGSIPPFPIKLCHLSSAGPERRTCNADVVSSNLSDGLF